MSPKSPNLCLEKVTSCPHLLSTLEMLLHTSLDETNSWGDVQETFCGKVILRCVALLQEPKTLGPFVVGLKQTRREQIAAWYGVAALFFVVLVPTLNSTILAYFTSSVRLPASHQDSVSGCTCCSKSGSLPIWTAGSEPNVCNLTMQGLCTTNCAVQWYTFC